MVNRDQHDATTAKDLHLQRASDITLLQKAAELDRLFLTRGKDFGALVFLGRNPSAGVIRLAVNPTIVNSVHEELGELLTTHTEEELKNSFCVVEPNRYRIRKLHLTSDSQSED